MSDEVTIWATSRSLREWNLAIGDVARECMKRPMSKMEARLLSMLRGISRDLDYANQIIKRPA